MLWPPDVKNGLIGKDSDVGKAWRQEEKRTTEDEMAGWHHRLDGHEFEQALGLGDGQGSLTCCRPWGHKESDRIEQLNWTGLNHFISLVRKLRSRKYQWFVTSAYYFFFLKIYLIFNWRIKPLQNFVAFCQTSMWITHRYICMSPPSWTSLPFPSPAHPSGLIPPLFEFPTSACIDDDNNTQAITVNSRLDHNELPFSTTAHSQGFLAMI